MKKILLLILCITIHKNNGQTLDSSSSGNNLEAALILKANEFSENTPEDNLGIEYAITKAKYQIPLSFDGFSGPNYRSELEKELSKSLLELNLLKIRVEKTPTTSKFDVDTKNKILSELMNLINKKQYQFDQEINEGLGLYKFSSMPSSQQMHELDKIQNIYHRISEVNIHKKTLSELNDLIKNANDKRSQFITNKQFIMDMLDIGEMDEAARVFNAESEKAEKLKNNFLTLMKILMGEKNDRGVDSENPSKSQ
jgi:hypothetical protein